MDKFYKYFLEEIPSVITLSKERKVKEKILTDYGFEITYLTKEEVKSLQNLKYVITIYDESIIYEDIEIYHKLYNFSKNFCTKYNKESKWKFSIEVVNFIRTKNNNWYLNTLKKEENGLLFLFNVVKSNN